MLPRHALAKSRNRCRTDIALAARLESFTLGLAMRYLLATAVLFGLGSAAAQTPRLDRYGDPLPAGAVARLGSLRLFCADDLANVVFSPDGRIVAAVLQKGPTQFWEVATGRAAPMPADGHRFIQEDSDASGNRSKSSHGRAAPAHADAHLDRHDLQLAVASPDGTLIATSSRQQPFRLWDGRTLKELPAWPGQKTDSRISWRSRPTARPWPPLRRDSRKSGTSRPASCGTNSPALGWQSFASMFSPDGKTLAVADGETW